MASAEAVVEAVADAVAKAADGGGVIRCEVEALAGFWGGAGKIGQGGRICHSFILLYVTQPYLLTHRVYIIGKGRRPPLFFSNPGRLPEYLCTILLEVNKYGPHESAKRKRVNTRFPALYKALLAEPDKATRVARLRRAVNEAG